MAIWDWYWNGANRSLITFLETLEMVPGLMLVQLLVGWPVWGPMVLIAVFAGMPVWFGVLSALGRTTLPTRVSVLIATLLIVGVTALGTDILFMALNESPISDGRFVYSSVFGPAAALIATLSTQILYGFD